MEIRPQMKLKKKKNTVKQFSIVVNVFHRLLDFLRIGNKIEKKFRHKINPSIKCHNGKFQRLKTIHAFFLCLENRYAN